MGHKRSSTIDRFCRFELFCSSELVQERLDEEVSFLPSGSGLALPKKQRSRFRRTLALPLAASPCLVHSLRSPLNDKERTRTSFAEDAMLVLWALCRDEKEWNCGNFHLSTTIQSFCWMRFRRQGNIIPTRSNGLFNVTESTHLCERCHKKAMNFILSLIQDIKIKAKHWTIQ